MFPSLKRNSLFCPRLVSLFVSGHLSIEAEQLCKLGRNHLSSNANLIVVRRRRRRRRRRSQ